MNDPERLKICQLVMKKIDGALSAQEEALLCEELEKNQEAIDIYVDLAIMYSSLSSPGKIPFSVCMTQDAVRDQLDELLENLSQAERDAEPVMVAHVPAAGHEPFPFVKPVKGAQKISKTTILSLVISAAAMLFVVLFIRFAPVMSSEPVGTLSRTVNARWLDSSGSIVDGCALYAGPLHLEKGYAEIYTDNGSQVILQAPVELDMESDSQLLLRKGHITVKVKPGQNHYVVRTPSASVVDFGTEFGVYVNDSNNTLTYVYDGRVELRSGSDPLRAEDVLKLNKGRGAQADAEGRLRINEKLSNLFVRSDEFDAHYTAVKGSKYQQWLAYSYRLRRDPDIVLYYPFLKSDESLAYLPNYAANTEGKLNGAFGGTFGASNFTNPTWISGRWPGKTALKFERDKRNCVLVAESPELPLAGDITLTVWACCPEPEKGGHLFSNRVKGNINYQFGCFSEEDPYYSNRLQFLRSSELSSGVYASKLFHWTSDWTFLVVTHDGKMVRFYVDGELFEAVPFVSERKVVSTGLFIGDVPAVMEKTFGYAAFNGLIDEMAIFKRVLTPEEIQKMYQAGKPEF